MSDTPDSERPNEKGADDGPARPPYPGWSAQQPPGSGWTAPGQQPAAGQGWGQQPPGQQPPGQQPPGQQPPGTPPPPPGTPGAPSGWGTGASWGWQMPPTVKPGVIPLRPLGVGEILDGAVTTIRRNPGPMLGLSAIVAIIVQLIGLAATWAILRNLDTLGTLPDTATVEEALGAIAAIFGGATVVGVVSWIATVILTGILTVVVSRAVLGEHLTVSEAWNMAKRRLPKLLLLTIVYALIWLSPFVGAAALIALLLAAGAGGAAVGLGILAVIGAVVVAIWLYVRFSLATPALMLESTPGGHPGGEPRRIGIWMALRRSVQLVRRSWWRMFGILILVWLVAIIVTQVIGMLFSIPFTFGGDPFELSTATSLGMLILSALAGVVSTTIISPFLAAAVVLLYVDRRIRSEALDIELARAAGVTIPGRTDQPPPAR